MSAQVTIVNAPNGVAHTADTVRRMAMLARKGAHTYAIRSLATKIVHDVPGKDVRGEIAAIYRWVRDHIRYRFDPRGLEWIQAPIRTVQEKAGDCDDMTILIVSLCEALGHQCRFRTVGKTHDRQAHVHAQVNTGRQWIAVDPVLEPRQATTAPRESLGMFGAQAQGAERIYDQEGRPMNKRIPMVRTKRESDRRIAKLRAAGCTVKKIRTPHGTIVTRKCPPGARVPGLGAVPADIALWIPTFMERHTLPKPRIETVYGSAGIVHTKPIRTQLWNNPYYPGDLAGGELGFNFLKAIGSVAKVASAVGIPGAGAIAAGIDIGSKFLPKGGKKGGAAPAAAAPGYSPRPDAAAANPAVNLAPAIEASVRVSRDAIAALVKQNDAALRAVTALARGEQATRSVGAKTRAAIAKDKSRTRSKVSILRAKAGLRMPKKRQRWDPKQRRWIVYQARPLSGLGLRPQLSLHMGAVDTAAAASLAPGLAADIASRGFSYSRQRAKDFQSAAGLTPDGQYGGGTAGALRYFLRRAPPRPLFRPTTETPYTPAADYTQPAPQLTPRDAMAPAPFMRAPTAPSVAIMRTPTAPSVAIMRPPTPPSAPAAYIPGAPPLSRRELAAAAINAVNSYIKRRKRPPRSVLSAVSIYQRAARIGTDGKYGPKTRAAAAADLGVAESTLPRSAYDRAARRHAPRSTPRSTPTRAPTSSPPPIVYDPIATSPDDPGLPRLDDQQPDAGAPSSARPSSGLENQEIAIIAGLYFWNRNRKRRAA